MMIGTDGGMFVSADEGATWSDQKNVGLVDDSIYAMATSGADPKSVLVGLQDNGTRIRSGNTGVFNQSYGGDGFGVGWSQAGANVTALGSYVYGYIYSAHKAPNIQKKWTDPSLRPDATCCYNGINACNAYFVTPIATPERDGRPERQHVFHQHGQPDLPDRQCRRVVAAYLQPAFTALPTCAAAIAQRGRSARST